ncbi:Erythromycin esterase [Aquisphaera giovannonii]|uniref:Erythromycin esterase n=1 Tax=Aquisphaera giovannonii TaxID=406548 RepID=A0A5B9VXE6_9BACT|nr:Erythromycin esterase [Aquisphaera giovannonii]
MESAFPESRRLADYVAGGPGTPEDVVAGARTWWHEPLEESLQLVRWMHARNARPATRRPIRFYAIDLSYTGPWGSRPTPAGIAAALAYLGRVDPASARTLRAASEPWLRRLANPTEPWTRPEHDAFTAVVDDLVALLERERVDYLAAAPAADYDWAHRAAVVAKQTDRMFRVAPTDPPGDRVPSGAWRMINARDAAMAENVLWALGQEGPAGRVLVVAHNLHVQAAATAGGPWGALERMPTSMGQHLRAALGDRLVVIGMREAAREGDAASPPLPSAPRPFLLDVRTAGEAPPRAPGATFDALLVLDPATPARAVGAGH